MHFQILIIVFNNFSILHHFDLKLNFIMHHRMILTRIFITKLCVLINIKYFPLIFDVRQENQIISTIPFDSSFNHLESLVLESY